MERSSLVVLSNRGPVSFGRDDAGQLVPNRGGGGLITALGSGVEKHGALWLAAAMSDDDREAMSGGVVEAEGFRLRSLVVEPDLYRGYYDVFANQTLWFLHHGLWDLPRRPRFDRRWWQAWSSFQEVNHRFAQAAAEVVAPDGTVLIHDYQLSLVGAELARLRPDVRSVVFIHTPFCQPGELQVLPQSVGDALLSGLSGAGACGFHTQRWATAFEACCRERRIDVGPIVVIPAAADAADIASTARSADCDRELQRLDDEIGDRQFIVRVDRIELSKNLLRGFYAFDDLLTQAPELRSRVIFGAFVYPSRQTLAEYLGYRQEVETLVRSINAKWATAEWTPILLDTGDNYPRSIAALRRYDVLLVNPVRDGLNLVSKEGPIVNQRNGLLALSPSAGAWEEMGTHALELHPFDISGTADALLTALTMTGDERSARSKGLRKAATARTPLDWFADQLSAARLPGS
jgi:trehalose 6-phosphate synthase